MTAPVDLDALDALEKEATEAPWCVHPNGTSAWQGAEYDRTGTLPDHDMVLRAASGASRPDMEYVLANLELVVALRNAYPALSAELRRLRKEREAWRRAMPVCVYVRDLDTSPWSCDRPATKGPQDPDDDFMGDVWCDEHAPKGRDIEDGDWLEDLPWADLVRDEAAVEGK